MGQDAFPKNSRPDSPGDLRDPRRPLDLGLAPDASAQTDLASLAEKFTFREVGPANPGGRITDVEGVESAPHIIYIGTATGGVWRTVNAGITWEPLFDDQPIASIGDIGLSKSDPNVLYVGTGEPNNRNSSPWGAGVFKSTDGGENWTFLGLKETRHISRVVVHPTNPDIVYVAAMGHLWGFNEERGVFKTTDGGENWEKVLYLDEETGITDLAMDPVDPDILYAVGHMRERDKFDAGDPVDQWGPKAGIYVTHDGGGSWTKAEEGLPTVEMGRAGIDVSRSSPGTVYAVVSTEPPPRPEGGAPAAPGSPTGGSRTPGSQPGRNLQEHRLRRHLGEGERLEGPTFLLQPDPGGPQRRRCDLGPRFRHGLFG